jgi:alpha-N-arabinofuranosidase
LRDDFNASTLGHQWNFIRNPKAHDWSLKARPGFLRLIGSEHTLDDIAPQCVVVRRQQHFEVRCRTSVEFEPCSDNEEAGMCVRAREGFHYDLALRRVHGVRRAVLAATLGGIRNECNAVDVDQGSLILEIRANAGSYTFSVIVGVRRLRLGSLATRALSSESISRFGSLHFTGAMIGLFATGHGRRSRVPADFDWFEYAAR